jgi:hypothetical protein
VESVENQKQVSHASHRPLEISQNQRDFHIPTAPACAGWKSGKPKAGFPLFHTAQAMMIPISSSNTPTQERTSAAARPPHTQRFMLILHWNQTPDFMLILGLENARRRWRLAGPISEWPVNRP